MPGKGLVQGGLFVARRWPYRHERLFKTRDDAKIRANRHSPRALQGAAAKPQHQRQEERACEFPRRPNSTDVIHTASCLLSNEQTKAAYCGTAQPEAANWD
jgi:hypothetical protein